MRDLAPPTGALQQYGTVAFSAGNERAAMRFVITAGVGWAFLYPSGSNTTGRVGLDMVSIREPGGSGTQQEDSWWYCC